MNSNKIIIALVGKAGSGKDTIAQHLYKKTGWNAIVSCTTRPMREGEEEGKNYFYLTNEEFAKKVLNGDMLEATYFNGWHYGTDRKSLTGGINIGVFNPEGYDCIREIIPSDIIVLGFFIDCKPKTRMLRQLEREENPDINEIVRRWSTDNEDFEDLENNIVEYGLDLCWNENIDDLFYNIEYITKKTQDVVDSLGYNNSENTTDSQV